MEDLTSAMFLRRPRHKRSNQCKEIRIKGCLRHHILAIDDNGTIRSVSQSDMENRTIFSGVDLLTGVHRLDCAFDITLVRKSSNNSLVYQFKGSDCKSE